MNETIEKLAALRINRLMGVLTPDDHRWMEIVSFRGWTDEFHQWLKDNNYDCIPEHAKKFISRKEKETHEEQDWVKLVQGKIHYENTLHNVMFHTLLEKRLEEYKKKPYGGRLGIGHFLGIKKDVKDNPYEYDTHVIGQIEDYVVDDDGNISAYVLSKADNTVMKLLAEMTYRVY